MSFGSGARRAGSGVSGAAFMQKSLGLAGGGEIIIRNELNGRVLTEEVLKNMPGVYRLHRGNR